MAAREETLQLAFGHKRPLADVNRLGTADLQEEVVPLAVGDIGVICSLFA